MIGENRSKFEGRRALLVICTAKPDIKLERMDT